MKKILLSCIIILCFFLFGSRFLNTFIIEDGEDFSIINNRNSISRVYSINSNVGVNSGNGFTNTNDANHRVTFGIGGENNSTFPDTAVMYNEGYGPTWFAVDGNDDFVWFTDPTDSHDNSSLSNEVMRLSVAGLLSIERIALEDIYHAYGGFQDEAETITITAQNAWSHVTNAAHDLWTGLESDGLTLSGDNMTIANAGDYVGSLSMTISGSNGKDFQIRVYNTTQAAQMGYVIGATTTGTSNFTNITLPLYLEAGAGDEFQMQITCTTAAIANPILRSAVFELKYLHE